MSEMIERVASAICQSRSCEGVNCCQWPANAGRLRCPVRDGGYYDAARAAIEAMREPTEAMLEAGCASHPVAPYSTATKLNEIIVAEWNAMVEELLK